MRSETIFVAGIPKAQPRPRAFARNVGGKVVARVYDAGTAEHWKQCIAVEWMKDHAGMAAFTGPVMLEIVFSMPRPKSHHRKNGDVKPDAPCYHTGRPDLDNLEKAVMDALTMIGVWRDDGQVCEKWTTKEYNAVKTGAQITIKELLP